jgi:hypothetical protein
MHKSQLYEKVDFKVLGDERGNLTPIELKDFVAWEAKRMYYLTNVTLPRGGHTVIGERKIFVMAQGSTRVKIFDGENWFEEELHQHQGIVIKDDLWREFDNFSPGAVLIALNSTNHDESKYIRNMDDYIAYRKSKLNE